MSLDKFTIRIFKVLTSNKSEISPYIFNDIKQRWEYLSKRRRVWKKDLNNGKFKKFLKKIILPTLKTVRAELLEKIPYIKELLKMFMDKEAFRKIVQNLLTKLLPLLTAAGTQLLLAAL